MTSPGETGGPLVAVIGGGQLGRMMGLAGISLGLRFRFLDPGADPPAQSVGELIRAPFDDEEALARLADGADVVTYEFENVPVGVAEALARWVPVFPPPSALAMAQDRLTEKEAFRRLGIATAPFRAVDSQEELEDAAAEIGYPAVLKTRRWGYDGKGQKLLRTPADLVGAFEALGRRPLLLEGFVDFRRELSAVAVRGRSGEVAFYPLSENLHREGILRVSRAPAPGVTPELQENAETLVQRVLEELDYVGVLAVEFFDAEDGLMANEMAPRVHNSGHWTQNGDGICQFENHLRAILGLPLGTVEALTPMAMVNLIGTVPESAALLEIPGVHLHLYGKVSRAGRKLGHVNVRGRDWAELEGRVERVLQVVERIDG